MIRYLRQSLPARVAAVGFIVVIVLGNVWLTYGLTGQTPPVWVAVSFLGGMVIAGCGGLGLAYVAVRAKLLGVAPDDAEDDSRVG